MVFLRTIQEQCTYVCVIELTNHTRSDVIVRERVKLLQPEENGSQSKQLMTMRFESEARKRSIHEGFIVTAQPQLCRSVYVDRSGPDVTLLSPDSVARKVCASHAERGSIISSLPHLWRKVWRKVLLFWRHLAYRNTIISIATIAQ